VRRRHVDTDDSAIHVVHIRHRVRLSLQLHHLAKRLIARGSFVGIARETVTEDDG
jgi:hypothetical protein